MKIYAVSRDFHEFIFRRNIPTISLCLHAKRNRLKSQNNLPDSMKKRPSFLLKFKHNL